MFAPEELAHWWSTNPCWVISYHSKLKKIHLKNKWIKWKKCINHTSEKLDMYEFKISLFDNGNSWESLLFVQNFNIMLEAAGTLGSNSKIQYFRTLLRGELLTKFNTLCLKIGMMIVTHLNQVILGLVMYYFIYNELPKQNNVINCIIRKLL